MILRINPNRMELIRLRKRLMVAYRGHKLLEDKLEEMMRKFLALLKDVSQEKENFQRRTRLLTQDLLYCRARSSQEDFQKSLAKINTQVVLTVETLRIMNVRVPLLDVRELKIDRQYDFFKTSGQLDLVIAGTEEYVRSLLKLAQLLKTLDILSYEIERTRRRVNALEYILIPSIRDTIRYITQKLTELERGNLVRLMRVKEIVRAH